MESTVFFKNCTFHLVSAYEEEEEETIFVQA